MKSNTAIYLFVVLLLCIAGVNSAEVDVTFDSIELSFHPKGDGLSEKIVMNNGFINGSRMSDAGEPPRILMSSRKMKQIDLMKLQQLYERVVKKEFEAPEIPDQKETGYFSITIYPVKGKAATQYAIGDKPFAIPELETIRSIIAAYDVGGW